MSENINIKEFVEVSERSKSNSHRLDKAEDNIEKLFEQNKALYSLASSVEKISMSMEYLKSGIEENSQDLKDMKSEIEKVKSEPFKNKASIYDKVIFAIGGALGMGIVYFLLETLFPNIFN